MNENKTLLRPVLSYVTAIIGALAYLLLHLPLPWILGAVTALFVAKLAVKQKTQASGSLRKLSYVLLGIQIGGTFTVHTFQHVSPYLFSYILLTFLLIFLCMVNAYVITKWVPVDIRTSMLGSIPGGLSAVTALSESMRANTVLVTIFQTIRLISILFIIPFAATHLFQDSGSAAVPMENTAHPEALWTIGLYLFMFLIGYALLRYIPSALVVVPMLLTAVCEIIGLPMYTLPNGLFIFAQLTIGVYLGHSISISDLKKAGRFCVYYFGLSLLLILIAFGSGYVFSIITSLNMATSVLSMAPGGLVEMALTAQTVDGDPSIVSSLQTIRLLIIVLILPLLLQWMIPKLEPRQNKEEIS